MYRTHWTPPGISTKAQPIPGYATHMDGDRIGAYILQRHKVESAGVLEAIARERVPAEVGAGDNTGNHRSALKHRGRRT